MTSRIQSTRRRKDVNRLRGQSARSRTIVVPDPIRHFLSESPIDRKTHEQCFNTSSSALGHYNDMENNQRYRITQGYIPVNTNRHAACAGPRPIDNDRPRTRHRILSEKTLSKSVAYCPELTKGEKLYLYNISRVYSTKNMHTINQRKYATVLSQEEQTGRYNQRDIDKYWNYIRSPRQTGGSGKSSITPKRTKSAPPGKRQKRKVDRPETRMEGRELSDNESQGTPRGARDEHASMKEKGIIETVLAETEDRKSDSGSHHSRGSKKSNNSKTRRRRSASRSSSSSSSRSRSSSSSSSSSRRSTSSDTETKHKRASDGETVVQRSKDDSQSKESDTQESRATDNEMSGRPDPRASDTGDEDTSRGKKEAYSSMSDSRGNDSHLREGHGRPKSRFGRKNAHKDEDDSDSFSSSSKSSSSSTHSSNSDKSKTTNQKTTSKKPMAKIEEQTKTEITNTTEANQQTECDTSVSESKDYSQITTTTDHSTSDSRNNESESSHKAKESKKKTTKSRYMESRRTRTNSESSLTQSITSNKSSDKKPRQRKSSRTSIKSNGSIKNNPTAETGKQAQTATTTQLENVREDGEQMNTKKTYRSISLVSQTGNGDLLSNDKDVDKIQY